MNNRSIILNLFAMAGLALSPIAEAVVPAPDGGYPGFNTAEGQNALFSLTTGVWNTTVGAYSLFSDTTGNGNTAIGINDLRNNVTGSFNTAVGLNALYQNTADSNSAFGAFALFANASGIYNTAIGAETLINNTSGSFNTAIGFETLAGNDTGAANTAVGYQALLRTTGVNNTAIGNGAGATVRTGSYNVYLGAGVGGVATDEVGHTFISNINSTVQPPGGSVEYVTINLNTRLLGHASSSRRYKEDILPMANASEAVYRLKPVSYRYRKEIDSKQSAAFGLIAEEVAEVNPHLIARNSKGQPESVHYEMVNAMLLNEFLKEHKTVQDLRSTAAKQDATITELQSNAAKQHATIAEQQKGMDVLTAQLKEQAAKIRKVSAQIQLRKPARQIALNNP